jgi:hypothetical protein
MADTSGEPPVRRIQAGAVFGGVVVGVVLSWFTFAVVLLTGYSAGREDTAIPVMALGLPAVAGIVLLAHPRSRQAGTGFLMGLAIGMITGSGVCGLTFSDGF